MVHVHSKHPAGMVVMTTGDITRYAWSMQSLSNLHVPPSSRMHWVNGPRVAQGVNKGIEEALQRDLAWAFLMGDDHTYPHDLLLKLLDREKEVIAPICATRIPPHTMTFGHYTERPALAHYTLDSMPQDRELIQLKSDESIGDAGLLLQASVLKQTGPPWQREYSGGKDIEDREYVEKVIDAGFEVWMDLVNPIGHIGNCIVTPRLGENGWYMDYTTPSGPYVT